MFICTCCGLSCLNLGHINEHRQWVPGPGSVSVSAGGAWGALQCEYSFRTCGGSLIGIEGAACLPHRGAPNYRRSLQYV